MRRLTTAAVVLIVATALPALAAAVKPIALPPMTPEKWRADIDFLSRELPKRHMNAFHYVTREEFGRAVADLRAKAETANDDEIIAGLLQIGAMIGDGHTRLHPPASIHRLPVNLRQFGEDFRITHAKEEAKALLGGRLVRIDDTPIAEVTKRLRTVISQDESEWFVRGAMPAWIVITEVLHGLHVIGDPLRVRLTVVDETGKETTSEVVSLPGSANPMEWPSAQSTSREIRVDPQAALYIEPARTVYVSFRRYDDLKDRARELWSFVDSKPVEKLVIDLRQNGGGDYNLGRKYLVSELKARPKIKPYVLIGPRTFSAAMNNAIDFRNDAHATLVGLPIGEKANSYQENDEMTLPNSKLVVSYSTRFYKFLPDAASPIVMPDKQIALSWEDFVAGRDPALDWILAQK